MLIRLLGLLFVAAVPLSALFILSQTEGFNANAQLTAEWFMYCMALSLALFLQESSEWKGRRRAAEYSIVFVIIAMISALYYSGIVSAGALGRTVSLPHSLLPTFVTLVTLAAVTCELTLDRRKAGRV